MAEGDYICIDLARCLHLGYSIIAHENTSTKSKGEAYLSLIK